MPSFFEGLKRLIMGQPVYTVEQEAQEKKKTEAELWGDPIDPETKQEAVESTGPKVVPVVTISGIRSYLKGDDLEVECDVANSSPGTVELDKIEILGEEKEINDHLRAGEKREFDVYYGDAPTSTSEYYVDLFYKDEQGDYFRARHFIEFKLENDNKYSIVRIRFTPPVKDV